MMRIHNKQFIIGNRPVLIHDDWKTYKISDWLFLSYCPNLRLSYLKTSDGFDNILIGFPTLPATPDLSPESIIRNSNSEKIEEETYRWGGRWIILSQKGIITDASTLQAIFYSIDKKWLSSSPVLISELYPSEKMEKINLSSKYYFNWFLPPLTAYPNIKKLLISQKIQFEGEAFSVCKRQLIFNTAQSYKDIFEKLENLLINELKYIGKSFSVNVGLSSGYDSRLIYSVASAALNRNFKSYTQLIPNMTGGDYKIPGLVSKSNLAIKRKKYNRKKLALIDGHGGPHVLDSDRIYYCFGQWDKFSQDDVCIRGSILELAGKSSAHLYNEVPQLTDSVADSKIYLYALGDFRNFQLESLTEYFNWTCNEHKIEIESKKRFYWEQRVGGWLSYIEQSLDVLPATSLHMGNSLEIINLFLMLPPEMMKIKSFHIDFMRKHTPEVLAFPFNTSTKAGRLRQIIRNYYYKLKDKILNYQT